MSDRPIERIETGMWAKVQGAQPGQETSEEVFHFVPSNQVDLLENKISIDSPLGLPYRPRYSSFPLTVTTARSRALW